MAATVRLGGIKLSGELVQFDYLSDRLPDPSLNSLLQQVVSTTVNIPHLHQGKTGKKYQTTFCLAKEDMANVFGDPIRNSGVWARVISSMGTISVFPHSCDLSLVCKIMHVLCKNRVPLHGMSTSVSALVLHTDYSRLDEAVEHILTVCHLPENHTPLRPVIVLGDEEIETVAVYWEPKIRIYGMDIQTDLIEFQFHTTLAALSHENISDSAHFLQKFRMVALQGYDGQQLCLRFLVNRQHEQEIEKLFSQLITISSESELDKKEGVELVSFHGPHFQDRYGIADMAFRQLNSCGIELLGCGCTGTTVQLMTGEGGGKDIATCLEHTFVVP